MNKYFTSFGHWTKRNSPQILMWCGITSGLTSIYFAITGTKKFVKAVAEEKEATGYEKLPGKTIAKLALKSYWPVAVSEAAAVGCILGSNHINNQRLATAAMAYKLSETALMEFKEKAIETIGEKKVNDIKAAIAEDKIAKDPPSDSNGGNSVVLVGDGDILCYDEISGRYFKSCADKILHARNLLNERLTTEYYISLNEFYDLLGLEDIPIGDELGWNMDNGLLDISLSAHLSKDGRPCLSVGYSVKPRYDFSKLY